MRLKTFMPIWLIVVAGLSALILVVPQTPRSVKDESNPSHFSVVWKGFAPSYSNQTPDYYICINNLQDESLQMHIALQIQNFENSSYWFMIDQYAAPPSGWNATADYIGRVEVDETKTHTYSGLTRETPSTIPEGRITESVPLVVKAYYDASYVSLYSQANFTVRFHFIDLTSAAWTQLYYDNFDDGTKQEWICPSVMAYEYYRSWPYALYGYYFRKYFDTSGPFNETYVVFAIRTKTNQWPVTVYLDDVIHFETDTIPSSETWYQFAIPLPLSSYTEVDIRAGATSSNYYTYLDDVYVIAK